MNFETETKSFLTNTVIVDVNHEDNLFRLRFLDDSRDEPEWQSIVVKAYSTKSGAQTFISDGQMVIDSEAGLLVTETYDYTKGITAVVEQL